MTREEIAERHGIGHMAHKLIGNTPEELEADAAAKASLLAMLQPKSAHTALMQSIHGESEQAGDSFDGGVRESANESPDPEADHGAAIVEMVEHERWKRDGA